MKPCSLTTCPHWNAYTSRCILEESHTEMPGVPPAGSLVLLSLEIGRQLADHGATTFRAQGTCMYPTVRPGDLLHLASRRVDQIAVGEIAVCRRTNYLFGHRVIASGIDNKGRSYIETCPDTTKNGSDGLTYDEDVLGIVTAIERAGNRLTTEPRAYPRHSRLLLRAQLALIMAKPDAKEWLIRRFSPIQRTRLYQHAARRWFSRAKPTYEVRLALRAGQLNNLYHPLPPDQFDVTQPTWQGKPPSAWRLVLLINDQKQPAAEAYLALRPAECPHGMGWSLYELNMRARYRGLGLAYDLMEKATAILARSGMELKTEVSVE